MQKKWIGMTSILLSMSMLFTACNTQQSTSKSPDSNVAPISNSIAESKSEEKITLRFSWWGSDTRHKATIAALDKYMQLHPNIKIEAEYGGFDGYEQKLKTQLAGGSAPDLIQVDQPWLYDFSRQSEVFADLNFLKDVIDLTAFDAKFLADYSTVEKKLQGLPTGLNGMVIYYNKDFFQRYGIPEDTEFNWDNMLEYGKKVHDQSNGKDVLWNVDPNLYGEAFKYYVRQKSGNQFILDDYTLGFNRAEALEAMEYLKKFLDAGVVSPFEESAAYDKKIEQNPKWFKGEFGFTINWASNIPVMKKDVPFKTGVTQTIISKSSKNTAVITRPSQIFSISKNSKYVKETAALLNWLLNDKEGVTLLSDVRGTPASKNALKVLQDAGLLDSEIVKATEIALKTSGGPENGVTNNAELIKIRTDVIQKLAYKKSTPEQAADEMIAGLEQKLKELKAAR
jgi:oligogalacturonide transport system substrate-binding protein